MRSNRSLPLLVSLTLLILSFGGYIGRLISVHSQFMLVTLSFFFTACTLGFYFLVGRGRGRPRPGIRWRWGFLIWGPMGYFMNMIANTQSFRAFGRASETVVLNYTWPVFTVLFSRTLFSDQERPPSGMAVVFEGVSLLLGLFSVTLLATEGDVTGFHITNLPGLLWGLAAGASYGLFSAFSATVTEKQQPTFLLTAIGSSLLFVLPLGLMEWELAARISPADIGAALAMGFLVNGVSYITWTSALHRARQQGVSTAKIVAPMFLVPLLSLVVVSVLLGEGKIGQPYFLLSLLFSISGSVLAQRSEGLADMLIGQ